MNEEKDFYNSMVEVSNSIAHEIISKLLKETDFNIKWFCSKQGLLTCKVFLRKYLLKCWDFSSLNIDSKLSKIFTFLKNSGEFNHDECFFDFLFTVTYEQLTYTCNEVKNNITEYNKVSKNKDIEDFLLLYLVILKSKLLIILKNSRHGCKPTCNLNIQLINT